jgi:hypothetical protein
MRSKARSSSRTDVSEDDALYAEMVRRLKADPGALQDWVVQHASMETLEQVGGALLSTPSMGTQTSKPYVQCIS